jgi:hypothetical protein
MPFIIKGLGVGPYLIDPVAAVLYVFSFAAIILRVIADATCRWQRGFQVLAAWTSTVFKVMSFRHRSGRMAKRPNQKLQ